MPHTLCISLFFLVWIQTINILSWLNKNLISFFGIYVLSFFYWIEVLNLIEEFIWSRETATRNYNSHIWIIRASVWRHFTSRWPLHTYTHDYVNAVSYVLIILIWYYNNNNIKLSVLLTNSLSGGWLVVTRMRFPLILPNLSNKHQLQPIPSSIFVHVSTHIKIVEWLPPPFNRWSYF